MRAKTFLYLALVLLLGACSSTPLDEVPDARPLVAVAEIDGTDGRNPINGIIRAPAAAMFNPNTADTVTSVVPVEITASDERQIVAVELRLRQPNDAGNLATLWSNSLTLDADEEIFQNPFVFQVPFVGSETGITEAELEVIATDDAGQVNEPYRAAVAVDGSLPVINARVPSGEVSGTISVSGSAFDPESGVTSFSAFIDGDLIEDSDLNDVTSSSFAATIDTTSLSDGVHAVTVVAQNGVNRFVTESFTFEVFNNEAPEAEDDEATTGVGEAVAIDVLANDSDPDGDIITIGGVTTPRNGTVTIVGDALIEYTPDAGFSGGDSFSYTIRDGKGGVGTAKVTVIVGAEADPEAPDAP